MDTDDKREFSIKKLLQAICRHKFKLLLILLLIVVPYAIDRILANGVYRLWEDRMKVPSPMTIQEWFGFLGSYIGAIGTIIVGIVAYVQSKTIQDQGKAVQELEQQVLEMQKEVNGFQLNPVIRIEQAVINVRMSANLVEQDKIKKELERLYFSIYGEEVAIENDVYRYVEIRGILENVGIVPVVQCKITNITWKFGKIPQYRFNIKRNIIEIGKRLNIIIGDDIECKEGDEKSFWEDLYQHSYNKSNGFLDYDKSILKITCRFKTQYDVEYGKKWKQLPMYEIVCIITSEKNQLRIDNFHMHRMGEEE